MAARAQAHTEREIAFELNDKQYAFVTDDEHKFAGYIGGIGAGKTVAGTLKALRRANGYPGSLGLIGAPTYPLLRDTTMRTVFEIFPLALIRSWNKSEGHLVLRNGSEILFRSMDEPDRSRGLNLAWLWLDEAPLCGYYAWQVLKGRLRQRGFEPQAWITGSPHGRDRFAADFELQPLPGHALYHASTRENAHNLPPHYIEDLGYTGQFALQEIEGLFVSFEGLVYSFSEQWHLGEWEQAHPVSASGAAPAPPALRIGGVDWGYTNPAVALPIWVDYDDRAFVRDEYYERQQGLTGDASTVGEGGLSKAILEFTQRYRIQTWYCGPDEPEHISALNAMFGRHRLAARAVAAEDEITAGIETVRSQMALRRDGTAGLMLSARCAQTKGEFLTYQYPAAGDGSRRDPDDKPIKKFDHSMDAVRYPLHTALGGKTRTRRLSSRVQEELLARHPISSIGGVSIKKRTF